MMAIQVLPMKWRNVVLCVAAIASMFLTAQTFAQNWKPERAIEIIVLNAPGGGSDRIARMMTNVMLEKKYAEVPANVVNKPGGGGAVAYAYLNQRPGDGHNIALAGKAILTNNISGRGPSYTEFTPVAMLFGEYVSVTVKPDSPLKSGRDVIERLQKDPAALSFGIPGSLGNPNHQGAAAALKAAGVDVKKIRNVVFQSGSAATTAMLGGHVDVVLISAAYAASMVRNGQVRLLAVTAPSRMPGVLAEVPTWREQGYDAVVSNWRSVIGPKGMTAPQLAYWEQALKRITEADEWKKELEANFWTSEFSGSADLRKYMDRDNAQLRALLTDLGLTK